MEARKKKREEEKKIEKEQKDKEVAEWRAKIKEKSAAAKESPKKPEISAEEKKKIAQRL